MLAVKVPRPHHFLPFPLASRPQRRKCKNLPAATIWKTQPTQFNSPWPLPQPPSPGVQRGTRALRSAQAALSSAWIFLGKSGVFFRHRSKCHEHIVSASSKQAHLLQQEITQGSEGRSLGMSCLAKSTTSGKQVQEQDKAEQMTVHPPLRGGAETPEELLESPMEKSPQRGSISLHSPCPSWRAQPQVHAAPWSSLKLEKILLITPAPKGKVLVSWLLQDSGEARGCGGPGETQKASKHVLMVGESGEEKGHRGAQSWTPLSHSPQAWPSPLNLAH